ncbi:MAG: hypothetical protein KDB24_07070 [Microthrixaceae bacterium]|nr:hypothetical protein [Microthrixaceae bacterium]
MGSRFGGPKQLEPVGPNDEPIFAITANQAAAAGIERLILVTRAEVEERLLAEAATHVSGMEVVSVRQDLAGPPRQRPWGTAHAVAACVDALDGPFGVANGDDLYGDPSLRLLGNGLAQWPDEGTLVSFRLAGTLSDHGGVSRGICEVDDGVLVSVVETHGLAPDPDGEGVRDDGGDLHDADTAASMNLWGLPRRAAESMAERFDRFLAEDPGADEEFLLPSEIAHMMDVGTLTVHVVPSSGRWIGLTHRDDLPGVRAALRQPTGEDPPR